MGVGPWPPLQALIPLGLKAVAETLAKEVVALAARGTAHNCSQDERTCLFCPTNTPLAHCDGIVIETCTTEPIAQNQ